MKLLLLFFISTLAMCDELSLSAESKVLLTPEEKSFEVQSLQGVMQSVENVIADVFIKSKKTNLLRTDITSIVTSEWEYVARHFSHDDTISDMVQTPDGGFLFVGRRYYDDTDYMNAWIAKIDRNGNHINDYYIGGQYPDSFKKIIPMSNGNYLLIGDQYLNDTYENVVMLYQVDSDLNFIKEDNSDAIWVMRLATETENFYGASACERSDGSWVLLSTMNNLSTGDYNTFLALFNPSTKMFSTNTNIGFSDSNETAYDISCRLDDSMVVAASTNHNNIAYTSGLLFEMDASLALISETAMTQGYANGNMTFNALLEHSRDGLLIGGVAYNGTHGHDVFYATHNFDDHNFTIFNLAGWNNTIDDVFGSLSEGKNGNIVLSSSHFDNNTFNEGSIYIWNANHSDFQSMNTSATRVINMAQAIQNRDGSIIYGLSRDNLIDFEINVKKVSLPNKEMPPSLMLYLLN